MKHVRRALAVVAIGSLAVLSLAGCINNTAEPTGSPTTPAPATTPTSSPTAVATPVTLPCPTILTPQQVYDYNPNYVAPATFTPAAGSDAAKVVADSGVACGWVDETSGTILSVAIAQPAPSELASLAAAASSPGSPAKVAKGAAGYFSDTNGFGELQVFTSSYWIVISSPDFDAAGDALPTAKVVIGNLPTP